MAEQKGRLELMMDEFTDVHGTVLLGMHKELQTLKQDVEQRVDAKISALMAEVASADSKLHEYLSTSQSVCQQLDDIRSRASNEIDSAKSAALTDIGSATKSGQTALTTLRTSGINDLEILIRDVVGQRRDFDADSKKATESIATMVKEHQTRLDAALKFANQLNQESQVSLSKAMRMTDDLAIREAIYQQRLRNTLVALGMVCTLTIGVWIWLAQRL